MKFSDYHLQLTVDNEKTETVSWYRFVFYLLFYSNAKRCRLIQLLSSKELFNQFCSKAKLMNVKKEAVHMKENNDSFVRTDNVQYISPTEWRWSVSRGYGYHIKCFFSATSAEPEIESDHQEIQYRSAKTSTQSALSEDKCWRLLVCHLPVNKNLKNILSRFWRLCSRKSRRLSIFLVKCTKRGSRPPKRFRAVHESGLPTIISQGHSSFLWIGDSQKWFPPPFSWAMDFCLKFLSRFYICDIQKSMTTVCEAVFDLHPLNSGVFQPIGFHGYYVLPEP